MRQKTLTTKMTFARLDREMEREESLDRTAQIVDLTEPSHARLLNVHRLAWLGVKLCNSLLYRMLNLCEVGADEVFYAFRMRRIFAEMDLNPANFRSHHVLKENDSLRPANSLDLSGSQSNFEISWRTPWLYLIFLLLIWLLLF